VTTTAASHNPSPPAKTRSQGRWRHHPRLPLLVAVLVVVVVGAAAVCVMSSSLRGR
jgi:hypothetical protein